MVAFCEGAEADMHMFFERAGGPVLFAPRFGLDDAEHSDFDAALVLATMMDSQLRTSEPDPPVASPGSGTHQPGTAATPSQERQRPEEPPTSVNRSDRTNTWSDLSGSGARTGARPSRGPSSQGPQRSAPGSEEIPFREPRRAATHVDNTRANNRSAGPSHYEPEVQGQQRNDWQQTFQGSKGGNTESDSRAGSEHRDPLVPQERPARPHFYMDDDGEDARMSDGDEEEFEVPATPPDERGTF